MRWTWGFQHTIDSATALEFVYTGNRAERIPITYTQVNEISDLDAEHAPGARPGHHHGAHRHYAESLLRPRRRSPPRGPSRSTRS